MIVTFDVSLCTVSIYNMIGISADRFLAVFRPTTYIATSYTLTNTVILSAWLLGLAVSLPMYIESGGFSNWHKVSSRACYPPNDKQSRGYSIYAAFMAFIIPFTIIIVLYIAIAIKMRSLSKKRLERMSTKVRIKLGMNISIEDHNQLGVGGCRGSEVTKVARRQVKQEEAKQRRSDEVIVR